MNTTAAPYRFHAFEISYFSAKVRPALRAKALWYQELRADMSEVIGRTGMAFIPILITPEGETWQDSSEIFDQLEARHPLPPLSPASPVQTIAAALVELYSDEFGTIPAMHYRWGSEFGAKTAQARFAAMIGNKDIAAAAAKQMARARLSLGATDLTGPVIEAHSRDLLDTLSALFETQPYLLGERMSYADCALMAPVYGHFFNDMVSRKILLETAVLVVTWIERCNYPGAQSEEAWPAQAPLGEGLRAVLTVMGKDAAPLLLTGARAWETWADTRPADMVEPPRAVGTYTGSLRGTPLTHFTGSYSLWMLQRTLDAYAKLSASERDEVDTALEGTGWEELLAYKPRHRLGKKNFKLVFETR